MIILDRSSENEYHYLIDEIHENSNLSNDDLSDFEKNQRIYLKKLEKFLDENIPYIISNFFETSYDENTQSKVENLTRLEETSYENSPKKVKRESQFINFMMINEKSLNFEVS